jgi:uncharacterized protein YjbI with pentapeptide repeats
VISLDLGDRDLHSQGLHPAIFNLTSLRNLTLAGNDFMGASLPSAGFEHLTQMVHLDLSFTSFSGQNPLAWHNLGAELSDIRSKSEQSTRAPS